MNAKEVILVSKANLALVLLLSGCMAPPVVPSQRSLPLTLTTYTRARSTPLGSPIVPASSPQILSTPTMSWYFKVRDAFGGDLASKATLRIDGVTHGGDVAHLSPGESHMLEVTCPGELPLEARVDPTSSTGVSLEVTLCPASIRLVALGDSITAGSYLPVADRYPDQVARQLESALPGLTVQTFNAGRTGDDTQQALARVATAVAPHQPDITVVALGTNDVLALSLPKFQTAFQQLLATVAATSRWTVVADIPYKLSLIHI